MNRNILKKVLYIPEYPKPKYLYQYYSNIKNAISNISQGKLYLKKPSEFNDIFDTTLLIDEYTLFQYEFSFEYLAFLNTYFIEKKLDYRVFDSDYIECKNLWDAYIISKKKIPTIILLNALRFLLKTIKNSKMDNYRIVCFSERNNDLLMWAHYANNLKGVCLKFECNKDLELFSKACRIKYCKERPYNFNASAITKPLEWNYEVEWRIIIETNKRNLSTPSIVGIIVGEQVERNMRKYLLELAQEKKLSYEIAMANECAYKIDIGEDESLNHQILY